MSDNDIVIEAARPIEQMLREKHGATGRGLHELVSDVQGKLSQSDIKKMRFVATIRNQVLHEGLVLDASTRDGVTRASKEVLQRQSNVTSYSGHGETSSCGLFPLVFVPTFFFLCWVNFPAVAESGWLFTLMARAFMAAGLGIGLVVSVAKDRSGF